MARKIVLVVDDEYPVRTLVAQFLIRLGHTAETASDALEALRKVEMAEFDLVLADFNMPGLRGDELAREIKRRKQGLPVVLITGGGAQSYSDCFDGVLMKPFFGADLENTINSLT